MPCHVMLQGFCARESSSYSTGSIRVVAVSLLDGARAGGDVARILGKRVLKYVCKFLAMPIINRKGQSSNC